ncbi:uncharacterized protein [Amphiura filiformis]|uniref:uncharacterized protein n=1 Tax=Amphiura filiformis TaxID=82378 RepID=UPI003B226F83
MFIIFTGATLRSSTSQPNTQTVLITGDERTQQTATTPLSESKSTRGTAATHHESATPLSPTETSQATQPESSTPASFVDSTSGVWVTKFITEIVTEILSTVPYTTATCNGSPTETTSHINPTESPCMSTVPAFTDPCICKDCPPTFNIRRPQLPETSTTESTTGKEATQSESITTASAAESTTGDEVTEDLTSASSYLGSCQSDEFQCNDSACIHDYWYCDGYFDCADESDEPTGCYCETTETVCDDGGCVDVNSLCDGKADCGDGSDEATCRLTTIYVVTEDLATTDIPDSCTTDKFQCNDGVCINGSWYCDGSFDCSDESDEPPGCCGIREIVCDDGRCVDVNSLCDGKADCDDSSDEASCRLTTIYLEDLATTAVPDPSVSDPILYDGSILASNTNLQVRWSWPIKRPVVGFQVEYRLSGTDT